MKDTQSQLVGRIAKVVTGLPFIAAGIHAQDPLTTVGSVIGTLACKGVDGPTDAPETGINARVTIELLRFVGFWLAAKNGWRASVPWRYFGREEVARDAFI